MKVLLAMNNHKELKTIGVNYIGNVDVATWEYKNLLFWLRQSQVSLRSVSGQLCQTDGA